MNKNILYQLKVENFRNLQSRNLEFSENINVVLGNNGNGKTNLIEAIYFLFHGKSFRKKNTFPQMLSSDCVKGEIIYNAVFSKDSKDHYISGYQDLNGSRFFLNNKKSTRCRLGMVFISPHDSYLFFNDSSFRRDKINHLFGFLDPEYKSYQSSFNKILKQKNSVLKGNIKTDKKLLEIYNQKLSLLTEILIKKKKRLINEINPYLEHIFEEIFGEAFSLKLELKTDFNDLDSLQIFKLLSSYTEKELILKTTYSGQHKDDFSLFLDGFPAHEYASLGQQKMSYFSALFAFVSVFCCKFNESPIVLIDDVSGELDHIRLKQLLAFLKNLNSQVFLTSASRELFFTDEKIKVLNVSDGVFS